MTGELHKPKTKNIEIQTLNLDNESSLPHIFVKFKTRIHEKRSTETILNTILLDSGSMANLLSIQTFKGQIRAWESCSYMIAVGILMSRQHFFSKNSRVKSADTISGQLFISS